MTNGVAGVTRDGSSKTLRIYEIRRRENVQDYFVSHFAHRQSVMRSEADIDQLSSVVDLAKSGGRPTWPVRL
jgi:hypothetical protein